MTHDEARDLLTDRLLDDLPEVDRLRLERHLETCAPCRRAAARWAGAWESLGRLGSAPPDAAAAVRFGRLLERGRVDGTPSVLRRPARSAAAAAALLLLGFAAGRALTPTVSPTPGGPGAGSVAAVPGPHYMLLLRGDEPERRRAPETLRQEYGAWAGTLAASGTLVAAEELDPEAARWIPADAPESGGAAGRISGFFLVAAPSYDSAAAVARASPHVAYGGSVEVRRVVGGGVN